MRYIIKLLIFLGITSPSDYNGAYETLSKSPYVKKQQKHLKASQGTVNDVCATTR